MKKRVVYIATREPGYSRVSIVGRALHAHFEVDEILSRRKHYAWRFFLVAIRLVWFWISGRLARADAVFVGFFAQPIFPLIRVMYRGPIVADAYFSIYDTLVFDKQKTKPGSWLSKLCFWLDRHMLNRAELCFTDTQAHVEYLKSTFATPGANVCPLWISAESQSLPRSLTYQVPEPFVVLFWGAFIPLQGVDTIIRAASLLAAENVQFKLVGRGQTLAGCRALKEQIQADNVSLDGWKTPPEILQAAAEAHLALGIFGATDKASRVIPNKAFEALAMGIPLITRESPAAAELLTDGYDVMLVPAADADSLAQKIRWARDHYDLAKSIAEQGQATFASTASPQHVATIVNEQMQSLMNPQPLPSAGPRPQPPAGHPSMRAHQEV